MEKVYIISSIIINLLIFLAILGIALIYLGHRDLGIKQTNSTTFQPIYEGQDLTQKFTNPSETLYIFFIRLKNEGYKNTDNLEFRIEDVDGNIIQNIKFSGRNVGPDEWVKFQFEPINGYKGQMLTLRLKSDSKNQTESVRAFTDDQGNIVYRGYSKTNVLTVALNSLDNFIVRLAGDISFIFIYLILIIFISFKIIKK